jgi:precorrin-6B methylase 2
LDLYKFHLIAAGHTAFQLLWAGVKLDLYSLLSNEPGLNLQEIGDRIELKEYPCRVLLIGLTSLGLIKKQDEGYYNADLTEKMLVKGKPDCFAPVLGWQAEIVYPGLVDFLDSLKQGTNVGLRKFPGKGDTLYERLVSNPDLEQVFQDSMSALSKQANQYIVSAYDYSRFSHIVDAGGGDGTNAITLAQRYPNLKVTVFDSESVCQIASKNIAEAGLADRVFTHIGDFRTDPFPKEIDAIMFCHILTIWSMEHNLELLKKCRASLPVGGSVVIFNMMGDDDDTGPLSTALGSPYFLGIATGEGMLHAWKDYEQACKEAGFKQLTRVEDLPMNHGLLIADS